MSRILVVEDDQFFREALCDLLKKKGHETLQASNGKVAKELMTMQAPELVISDIQMPGLTGLELLEWSKNELPVPFIIMTGFSMILETKSAFDLGAKGFVAKPFKSQEMFDAIDTVLGPTQIQAPLLIEQVEYCKVSIDEFISRPVVDFDVFIKLSDSKFIKVAHAGNDIPVEKIEHFKSKDVRHLHIRKEDFDKLVIFSLQLAKIVNARSEVSETKRLNFIKYTGEVVLEKNFVVGVDKQSFNEAKLFVGLTIDTLSKSPEHLDLLEALNSHSNFLYAHSIGVTLFSVMIAKKLGLESISVLSKLSLASLYHDIGKKEIDPILLEKPRHIATLKERQLIESHVLRGQEILSALPSIADEVVQLVGEHHEDQTGHGYPLAKKKLSLHPLSRIIQLANIFVKLTVKGSGNQAAMAALPALQHIQTIYDERIDDQALRALRSLFN